MIVAEADSPANRDVIGAAVGLEAALLKSGAETPLRLGLLAPGLVAGVEVRDLELELPSEAEDLRDGDSRHGHPGGEHPAVPAVLHVGVHEPKFPGAS